MRDLQYTRDLRQMLELRHILDLLDLRNILNMLDLRLKIDLRQMLDLRLMRDLRQMVDLRHMVDLRGLRGMPGLRDLRDLLDLPYLRYMLDLFYLRYMLDQLDLPYVRDLLDLPYVPYIPYQQYLRKMLNQDHLLNILCSMLLHPVNALTSAVLLALYSVVISYESIPTEVMQQVHTGIQAFAPSSQHSQPLSIEHRLLIAAILRHITPTHPGTQPSPIHKAPDAFATAMHALTQSDQLTRSQVEELLKACTDTRKLSQEKTASVKASSVQEVALRLLSQPFTMEEDALSVVVQALDNDKAIICAAAALLLKSSKTLPQHIRKEAAQKSMKLLADDELSRRSLDTPDYRVWLLDDVLFETLQVLAK